MEFFENRSNSHKARIPGMGKIWVKSPCVYESENHHTREKIEFLMHISWKHKDIKCIYISLILSYKAKVVLVSILSSLL